MDGINGVVSVTSGYAGGTAERPTHGQVSTGATGHAQVVQIAFTPSIISYGELLRIFMLMHNPAQMNRPEVQKGSQYRSVILYNSAAQEQTARQVIGELQAHFDAPIVTEVAPLKDFYAAETHHQQYYKSDPAKGYCRSVISPKLGKLRNRFLHYLKSVPTP